MRVNLLKKLLSLTEDQVRKFVLSELNKLEGYTITEHGEFVFAEPEGDEFIPVVLVAHMDTVHKNPPSLVLYDSQHRVMWSPDGLGADDRAGVFALLELMTQFGVAVLFTHGEESGGKGAHAFIKEFPENTRGYKVLIQLDRRGTEDCVFYRNDNEDFHQWISEYGFKKAWGSFSDISVIAPAWRVNSVNLSVGYFHEHTSTEHLSLDALINTITKVGNLLDNPLTEFPYKEKVYTIQSYSAKDKTGWGWRGGDDDYWGAQGGYYYETCSICNEEVDEAKGKYFDLLDYGIESARQGIEFVCDTCIWKTKAFKCSECDVGVIPTLEENEVELENLQICQACYDLIFKDEPLDEDTDGVISSKQEEKGEE